MICLVNHKLIISINVEDNAINKEINQDVNP